MRVRVSYTVEVSERLRAAIYYRNTGRLGGSAEPEEIRQHFRLHGFTIDDDLLSELDAAEADAIGGQQ